MEGCALYQDIHDLHRCYKVTPRMQNAKAYVNAAILMPVQQEFGGGLTVPFVPNILIGGIASNFSHARNTEVTVI